MYQVTVQQQPQTELQIFLAHLLANALSVGAGMVVVEVGRNLGLKKKTANAIAAISADLAYRKLVQGLPTRTQYKLT